MSYNTDAQPTVYWWRGRLYRNGVMVFYKQRLSTNNYYMPPQSKKLRTFSINKTKLQSACIRLWGLRRKKSLLFITFTFAFDVIEADASKIWKLQLDSLRNTYKIRNYVWVKEVQKLNNNRLHYHIIVDRDYIDIKKCQETFNNHVHCVVPDAVISLNSVRLGNNPRVCSVKAIKNYLR